MYSRFFQGSTKVCFFEWVAWICFLLGHTVSQTVFGRCASLHSISTASRGMVCKTFTVWNFERRNVCESRQVLLHWLLFYAATVDLSPCIGHSYRFSWSYRLGWYGLVRQDPSSTNFCSGKPTPGSSRCLGSNLSTYLSSLYGWYVWQELFSRSIDVHTTKSI
jgi:hypothetical protein